MLRFITISDKSQSSMSFIKFLDFFLELFLRDVSLQLHRAGHDTHRLEGLVPKPNFLGLLKTQKTVILALFRGLLQDELGYFWVLA